MTRSDFIATAKVLTASASKYLWQLCKHWSHSLAVEFTAERGSIIFPKNARGSDYPADALAILDATPDDRACGFKASTTAQLEHLKGVVARHLDRFAFRETLCRFAGATTKSRASAAVLMLRRLRFEASNRCRTI